MHIIILSCIILCLEAAVDRQPLKILYVCIKTWLEVLECFTPQTACWKPDHSYSQPLQSQVPGILPTHYFPGRVKNLFITCLSRNSLKWWKTNTCRFFFLQVCLKTSSIYHYILCSTHPPWKTEWCMENHINCWIRILALCNKMHNPHFVAWMRSLKFWYLPVFWLVFIRKTSLLKTNKTFIIWLKFLHFETYFLI